MKDHPRCKGVIFWPPENVPLSPIEQHLVKPVKPRWEILMEEEAHEHFGMPGKCKVPRVVDHVEGMDECGFLPTDGELFVDRSKLPEGHTDGLANVLCRYEISYRLRDEIFAPRDESGLKGDPLLGL
jgi:hypothetical protein